MAVIALVGSGLVFYVLKSIELKPVLVAATAVGWRGFTILCVFQLALFVLLGTAWYVLIPASYHSRAPVFIWARMVRDATSELLPFSHLGGIVLGARTAMFHGVLQPVAIGSIVTDVTTEMLAQIAFTAAGVVILTTSTPHHSLTLSIASTAAFGLATIVLSCAAFVAFQRYGRALTTKLISRLFPSAAPVTESIANCIEEIYRRPGNVGLSVLCHCGGWMATALSTWIALSLMGVHANVWSVLAIESLVCAVRSMAFLVPNGLGIQEVAYAAIAPLFGIGAEIGLAISVLKRAREIAVGLPILLLWQWLEGRNFFPASCFNLSSRQVRRDAPDS
ncbi:MAG TPA: lysylphosphatidylglycerol synthase domain-containing protein [Steroidobacteraceae bacterium]|nr:lysylphosphatidylglycerol synthase domain-containing protein [Steroidobacteraceae bacterium]